MIYDSLLQFAVLSVLQPHACHDNIEASSDKVPPQLAIGFSFPVEGLLRDSHIQLRRLSLAVLIVVYLKLFSLDTSCECKKK